LSTKRNNRQRLLSARQWPHSTHTPRKGFKQ